MNKKNKESLIGIIVFISYFIQSYLMDKILMLFGINYSLLDMFSKILYSLCYEAIFILIIIYIYRKELIPNFKKYIKNFKNYFKNYFKYWGMAFGMMLLSNILIVTLFPNSTATNQEIVNATFNQAPIYMIISAVIFAPILEELIFRFSIRKMFNSDKLFIIVSGLIFGSLHVIGSFETFQDLLYIIPYSIPGFVFAYTLVKSKNIFVPISLHFFHNGIMMFIQTILMFLL